MVRRGAFFRYGFGCPDRCVGFSRLPSMNAPFPLPPLVDDLSLVYRLCPARGRQSALAVLLHGVGANEGSLAGLVPLLPDHVATALVRSPFAMGPNAFSAFAVSFTASGPVIDADQAEASRLRLAAFVGELQARTGIAPARTVVAGFSQGGIMSAGLALTWPQAVAGFGLMSGRILKEIGPHIAPAAALAGVEGLILHGDFDDRLPAAFADQSAALLESLGVRFTQKRYPAGHEITRDSALDFAAWVARLLPAA